MRGSYHIAYYEKVTKKQCSAKNQTHNLYMRQSFTVNRPVNLNQPQAWGRLGTVEPGPPLLFGLLFHEVLKQCCRCSVWGGQASTAVRIPGQPKGAEDGTGPTAVASQRPVDA